MALDNFAVTNVSLPEELQKAIDTRISMGMMGDMSRYTQYQVASSIPLAAQNEGGVAGLGASLAAGAVMGQAMAGGLGVAGALGVPGVPAPAAPPAAGATGAVAGAAAPAPAADDPAARLQKLKELLDKGLVTQTEFDAAKAEILRKLVG